MTLMKALYVVYAIGFLLSIYHIVRVVFKSSDAHKGRVPEAFTLCAIFFYLPIINLICALWLMWERFQPARSGEEG